MTNKKYIKLYELCGKILELAFQGDYSNGNEACGVDEGMVRTMECLEGYEKQWKELGVDYSG